MKSLIVLSLFATLTAQAQNFSPSAGAVPNSTAPSGAGTILNQPSPSASGTGFISPNASLDSTAPAGASSILGQQTLNETNTAPTPIPEDTSLILTPSNDPLQQSQQEAPFGTLPVPSDSGTAPSGSETGSNSGGSGSGTTTPFSTFPETTR